MASVDYIPLRVKPGVRTRGLTPHALLGLVQVALVFMMHDRPCIVTSVTDGRHSRGSLHHTGEAFDVRRRHLGPVELNAIVPSLRRALGPEWDVVVEATHIHLEYDPS